MNETLLYKANTPLQRNAASNDERPCDENKTGNADEGAVQAIL